MASLGMGWVNPLNKKNIDDKVSKRVGNYALGYTNSEKTFIVKYVGRSDDDLNDRLKYWIGKYNKFKFNQNVKTRVEAYKKECRNFHDFGGIASLDNKIHPDRPDGYAKSNLSCPMSGCNE